MFKKGRHQETRQRFTIKKYSFGAASVLIGTFFAVAAPTAKAEEVVTTEPTTTTVAESSTSQETTVASTEVAVTEATEVETTEAPATETTVATTESTAAETTASSVETTAATTTAATTAATATTAASAATETTYTYVVRYADSDNGNAILQQVTKTYTTSEENPKLTIQSEVGSGALQGYELDTTKTQRDTIALTTLKQNVFVFYVTKKKTDASDTLVRETRATAAGAEVVRDGSAIVSVQRAYITTNDAGTAPTSWGIDMTFDTSQVAAGDTTTITMTNLASIPTLNVGTNIVANDGTVVGTVTSAATTFTGRGTNHPFFDQRTANGKTMAERIAETPAIPAETGTSTVVITWNDKASQYRAAAYSAANTTATGYIQPQVSVDTPLTASIAVDGNTIVETTYTILKSTVQATTVETHADLFVSNEMQFNDNVYESKNDALQLATDSDVTYGIGSTFTITLPNDSFTYFRDAGLKTLSSQTAGGALAYVPYSRAEGATPNVNNVWILNDGRTSAFALTPTLVSPTELHLTVTEGAIQAGSRLTIALLNGLGIEKVKTDQTLTDENTNFTLNSRGQLTGVSVGNTAATNATLTVLAVDPNGAVTNENVVSSVPVGWIVRNAIGSDTAVQTGEVLIEMVDIATGERIGNLIPTKYDGSAAIQENGDIDTTNVLGKPFDVTDQVTALETTYNNTGYVRVAIPAKNTTGVLTPTNVDLDGDGIQDNLVTYYYAKKTMVDEVTRTINYIYGPKATNPNTEAAASKVQTTSFTGTIKVDSTGQAVVDSNNQPVYENWTPASDTLEAVTSPTVARYTADQLSVDALTVSALDADTVVNVYYNPTIVTLDPSVPPVPAENTVIPTDPQGRTYEQLGLLEVVNQTVRYVYASDNTEASATVTDKVRFTRAGQLNMVTGEIVYTRDWAADNNDTTFDAKNSPLIQGFLANKATVDAVTGLTQDSADVEETIYYSPIGKYIITKPDGEVVNDPYPNHPTDPTKPGDPTTVVPYVPGYTPIDADGNPLTPVNPDDPTQGYIVPNIPTDAVVDTPISYKKDKQTATTKFILQGTTTEVKPAITDTGETATKLTRNADVAATIATLVKEGYQVVSSDYPTDGSFDSDSLVDQNFTVVVTPVVITDVDGPKTPGTPVDPKNPDGPVWPATAEGIKTSETVTRTIAYKYADGTPVLNEDGTAKTVTETLTFTRKASVNLVSGEVTYTDWTTTDAEFDKVTTPVLTGYLADKAEVAAKTVAAEDADITEEVIYTPLGKWIITPPTGDKTEITYPNDPTDPTQPGTDKPVVPYIPGYTPVDGNGNPLTPVDPEDPTKGYIIPDIPTNTGQDTPISYVAQDQTATTKFVNEKGEEVAPAITDTGKTGTALTKDADVATTIANLIKKGYELVSSDYPTGGKFDNDTATNQEFTVVVKPVVITDVDGPKTPGTPVDPNNPDGPVWPDTAAGIVTTETVTRTIEYKYEDGTPVLNADGTAKTVTETLTFTRKASVNLVTGEVTYTDWTTTDAEFDLVKTPVLDGYLADKAEVAAKTATATDADTTEVVTYKPIGKYVITNPDGSKTEVPYPNDPTDPTKPGTPTTVVPHIPGYVPVDGDGNPLTPVDPKDPSKGYIVPTIPTDGSTDTEIKYVKADATLTVKYVDESGKELLPTETKTGKVGDDYATSGKVIDGYILVRVDGTANGQLVEGSNTVTYVYKPIGKYIITNPDGSKTEVPYPNDPTDPTKPGTPTNVVPHVPGYTPVDGNGTPLTPVDPTDPTKGYIVPNIPGDPTVDTVISYVKKDATLTVKYVDENGKELAPAETKAGKVGDDYTTAGKVITGYLLVRVDGTANGKLVEGDNTVTYVYKPIGKYIITNPDGSTTEVPYPNDPTDPTKPGTPTTVVPYIPGYVPVDGNGNPLTPVDPTDPTKGYIVPNLPTDPGANTQISYVKADATLTVKYVDENGNELLPTETKTGKAGDAYTTAGKVITGYLLVRVDGTATGNLVEGSNTVTYVYKPIGKYIITNPDGSTTVVPYPNDPTDPTKPGTPTTVIPYVPGYTPVDGNGNPLTPVDPTDPTKGYIVPNLPADPGVDTPIRYVANPAPVKPSAPSQPAAPKYVGEGSKTLPNTGEADTAVATATGLSMILGALGFASKRRKKN